MSTKPSLVFCHGILADGSCFNKVMPAFQAEGYEVISAQYGLDTNEADVDARPAYYLGQVSSPAILVGHSYGGAVITAAGTDDRVAGLVYIAALAPDADETSQSLIDKFPDDGPVPHRSRSPTGASGCPRRHRGLLRDLPRPSSRSSGPPHPRRPPTCSTQAPGVAWQSKPSWYIVANNDNTVNPELERFVAKRMDATTYDIDSSHVPMLSHPDFVIDVIRDAIKGVQG